MFPGQVRCQCLEDTVASLLNSVMARVNSPFPSNTQVAAFMAILGHVCFVLQVRTIPFARPGQTIDKTLKTPELSYENHR